MEAEYAEAIRGRDERIEGLEEEVKVYERVMGALEWGWGLGVVRRRARGERRKMVEGRDL